MSQVKAEKMKKKAGGKKLTLRTETIKDLTARCDAADAVRGAAATYRGCVG